MNEMLDFNSQAARASFLVSLADDYPRSVSRLVEEIDKRRESPVGDADDLLVVSAARNVLRICHAVRTRIPLDTLTRSVLKEESRTFEQTFPKLSLARDLIEHADEYLTGRGRKADSEYFDVTRRSSAHETVLLIGPHEFDLRRLQARTSSLANWVHKAVLVWFNLELKLRSWREFAAALDDDGPITVKLDSLSDGPDCLEGGEVDTIYVYDPAKRMVSSSIRWSPK